jgi:NADH dehydrogenase
VSDAPWFVTGGRGYVGSRFLETLAGRGRPVRALMRGTADESDAAWTRTHDEPIYGDLLEPGVWGETLQGCTTVVHLAAITGKAHPDAIRRVIVDGTRGLLAAAKRAGVGHFVFVSTIAVRFPDQRHYPYAHAKGEAERLVRESGLPFTIVRPTIVVGPGAPVIEGLATLALAPLTPIFGDGHTPVQPIDVRDLAFALAEIAAAEPVGDVVELGGAETVSLEELMARIRRVRGGGPPRALHLPIAPFRTVLGGLEPLLRPLLPLTAGQLATFANEGVAQGAAQGTRRPLDEGLAAAATATTYAPLPETEALRVHEAGLFTRHLLGVAVPPTVVMAYLAWLETGQGDSRDALDASLLAFARRGRLGAALADATAARLRKGGALRRRLVALLGLLESVPPTYAMVDAPEATGALAWLRLAWRGVSEVALALIGLAILLPWHALRRDGRPS